MADVLMMVMEGCPHCKKAFQIMDELKEENPVFGQVQIRVADENKEKELADSLDYWYVPCYFVNGIKVHEGVPSKEKIKKVYEEALAAGQD